MAVLQRELTHKPKTIANAERNTAHSFDKTFLQMTEDIGDHEKVGKSFRNHTFWPYQGRSTRSRVLATCDMACAKPHHPHQLLQHTVPKLAF